MILETKWESESDSGEQWEKFEHIMECTDYIMVEIVGALVTIEELKQQHALDRVFPLIETAIAENSYDTLDYLQYFVEMALDWKHPLMAAALRRHFAEIHGWSPQEADQHFESDEEMETDEDIGTDEDMESVVSEKPSEANSIAENASSHAVVDNGLCKAETVPRQIALPTRYSTRLAAKAMAQ